MIRIKKLVCRDHVQPFVGLGHDLINDGFMSLVR
jgi:hypothetical protein